MNRPNARRELDDYVDVATRLHRFREKYPEGSIQTEVYHDDGKVARVRASVYRYDNLDGDALLPIGTGHAEEVRGEGFVNKTSALENCETSAVGRALAMAGFEVKDGIASREEVQQAKAEEQRQRAKPANGKPKGIDLAKLKTLRDAVQAWDGGSEELGLLLVTVGIEDRALADVLTRKTVKKSEAAQAATLLNEEQAEAIHAALLSNVEEPAEQLEVAS